MLTDRHVQPEGPSIHLTWAAGKNRNVNNMNPTRAKLIATSRTIPSAFKPSQVDSQTNKVTNNK
jgi:hypothetical protein